MSEDEQILPMPCPYFCRSFGRKCMSLLCGNLPFHPEWGIFTTGLNWVHRCSGSIFRPMTFVGRMSLHSSYGSCFVFMFCVGCVLFGHLERREDICMRWTWLLSESLFAGYWQGNCDEMSSICRLLFSQHSSVVWSLQLCFGAWPLSKCCLLPLRELPLLGCVNFFRASFILKTVACFKDWRLTMEWSALCLFLSLNCALVFLQELLSFVGHGTPVVSCCFVGSDRLCTASQDGIISLWDLSTGHRYVISMINFCASSFHQSLAYYSGKFDVLWSLWKQLLLHYLPANTMYSLPHATGTYLTNLDCVSFSLSNFVNLPAVCPNVCWRRRLLSPCVYASIVICMLQWQNEATDAVSTGHASGLFFVSYEQSEWGAFLYRCFLSCCGVGCLWWKIIRGV